ncbi:hypothetical protein IPC755_28675 [Pseudomonas aeruginosa]|uniref:hypothetical protein n=1 Tax=Pseudomonas aeruginosa TaxID=287 RepID=UPI000FC401F6|nr:hypothetical protein [Pseudomonas aeruginosa]RUG38129.1 hypothetical protein IPC755_28675 [Pseudomonas aeruginosa]
MKMNNKLKEYSDTVYGVARNYCKAGFDMKSESDMASFLSCTCVLVSVMFPSFKDSRFKVVDALDLHSSLIFQLKSRNITIEFDLNLLIFFAQFYYMTYELGIINREIDLVDAYFAICEDFKANGVSEYDEKLVERVVVPTTNPFFTKKAYKNIKGGLV